MTNPSPMRDCFVYRMYDANGKPLYFGFTRNLVRRRMQHRHERPAVFVEAATCKVRGPYTEAVARRVETAAILHERPFFNAEIYTPADLPEIQRRNAAAIEALQAERASA